MRFQLMASAAALWCLNAGTSAASGQSIDRYRVVSRHNPVIHASMPKSPAQVGNGAFAFGVDITGLQTFLPFSTLSDRSWHLLPLPEGKRISDYSPTVVESYGKKIPYLLDDAGEPEITAWLKRNPHRFNSGRIGFILLKEDGSLAAEKDLSDAEQITDLWTGIVHSRFTLEGKEVRVRTSCHPDKDLIGIDVSSGLLAEGRLKVFWDFPYADLRDFSAYVGDYASDKRHVTEILSQDEGGALLMHRLDDTGYRVGIGWKGGRRLVREAPGEHRYVLEALRGDSLEITCHFIYGAEDAERPGTQKIEAASAEGWKKYWLSGAAIDLGASKDPRWRELERRIVLSQFLMRLNESGLYPPQESGLVNNGWFGRFHFEMIWWHGVHFGLWGRMEYCDRYLGVYREFMPGARERAASEGRRGAKWPKCTGNINVEWPCVPHAMLIWQQPHPIYFAETEYRLRPTRETLDKWLETVVATADYMADYVFWDKKGKRYVIGPPVVPVSENTDPYSTLNPAFELGYFRYGLSTAIEWARRAGLPKSATARWRHVLKHLAEIPVEDGLYTTYEGIPGMWTKYNYEHPALAGIYGMLPGHGTDKEIFRRTFYKIMDTWQFDKVWGWDYPMLAMAAARIGDREKAVDLLLASTNKFGFDAHGLALTWPFPYFPANGGLLTAVAMMAAGWDGSEGHAPGFPENGWDVRHEGFLKMQ